MKRLKILGIVCIGLFLISCELENLERASKAPKTDFSYNNYVLATEDASDVDITTFFSFTPDDVDPNKVYDLIDQDDIFTNANPSTSSGHVSFGPYFFSMAKDKKGYSSTPGLYRLSLNDEDRAYIDYSLSISKNNLFPARQLTVVNSHLGYFYDEGKEAHKIQIFDPTEMILLGSIDLKPAIEAFRPHALWVDEAGNNMVRTGSLVMDNKEGKLYVSIVFLEKAGFNLIAEEEANFYLAVIDIAANRVEKIISYNGAVTVGFFVSENKATAVDQKNNLYFCSWGWNQFNAHRPSKIFRIPAGQTDFDPDWVIDVESLFGKQRIAQSIAVFNNKIYLHISEGAYTFADDSPDAVEMAYYEFDPVAPDMPRRLAVPTSNPSSRINVFSVVGDQLFMAVPNVEKGKFNGLYSVDRAGQVKKEMTIDNKYRPTRLYKLGNETEKN